MKKGGVMTFPQKPRMMRPGEGYILEIFRVGLAILALLIFNGAGYSQTFDGLNEEQTELAQSMLSYIEETEQKAVSLVEQLNGDSNGETRTFRYDEADYDVTVWRGSIIEKLGWETSVSKVGVPGLTPDPIWNRYMALNVHPKTPLVGQLHATIYFVYFKDGTSRIAGYMDYTPAAWIDEDVDILKSVVDELFEKHGKDITPYRAMLEKPYHKDKLKAAAVGVGLYAQPTFDITKQNVDFVKEVYDTFVDTYFDILKKRKDQAFTPADIIAQDGMRRRWLEDHLFSDPLTMNVVPYEVWSFNDQAPLVKF